MIHAARSARGLLGLSTAGTGKITASDADGKHVSGCRLGVVGESKDSTEDIWWILEGKDYPRLWWEAATAEIRDPRIEIRNKSQAQMLNDRNAVAAASPGLSFGFSSLEFVSDFEFRASSFSLGG
jgi:hypothetical protein